jgi:dTMP kinase
MTNYSGFFITVEGGEGAGKTIQIEKMKEFLTRAGHDVVTTREPGGVKVAEQIRNILLGPDVEDMDAMTEVLLYAASRREHFKHVILPALQSGKVVISDRFFDSSIVYQGYVKGEGVNEVYNINMKATKNIEPNLTLYFDIDPRVALKRIHQNPKREVNRFDKASLGFHEKVREGYRSLLDRFAYRFVEIDANQTIEKVFADVKKQINLRLASTQKGIVSGLENPLLLTGILGTSNAEVTCVELTPPSYNFFSNSQEVLKITPDGNIYWKGKKVETDPELVHAFREFLSKM